MNITILANAEITGVAIVNGQGRITHLGNFLNVETFQSEVELTFNIGFSTGRVWIRHGSLQLFQAPGCGAYRWKRGDLEILVDSTNSRVPSFDDPPPVRPLSHLIDVRGLSLF